MHRHGADRPGQAGKADYGWFLSNPVSVMARLVVISYLVLATAAGPWLCCCTAERLHAAVNLVAGRVGIGEGPLSPASCCHLRQHAPHPDSGASPGRPGERDQDGPCGCPGREDASLAAVLPPEKGPRSEDGASRPHFDAPAEAHGARTGQVSLSTGLGPATCLSLPISQSLSLLQLLRC